MHDKCLFEEEIKEEKIINYDVLPPPPPEEAKIDMRMKNIF
jgi:hypothetical protein